LRDRLRNRCAGRNQRSARLTKALESEEALRETFHAFNEHNVQFTIATDGPEMMRTHLRDEFELLLRIARSKSVS
jgi:imidazolonepropionase-like amidohydrolase